METFANRLGLFWLTGLPGRGGKYGEVNAWVCEAGEVQGI